MIRLVYITNKISGPGGLERVLSIKASYLAESLNYDVHIITLNQGDSSIFFNFSNKISLHDISINKKHFNYLFFYRKYIKEKLKELKPDIICVCDDGLKGMLLPLLIRKPCPMIYERHVSRAIELKIDNPNFKKRFYSNIIHRLMILGGSQYDKFVVLTKASLQEWKLKNLEVIPNPLSFYPEDISTLENKRVLAVGKHSFQKGYDRLFESWKTVQEKYPDWTLDIYGSIDSSEKYINLAKKMRLDNSINFYKPVRNIDQKYKESTIYLMSSRFEGFGMVLIEAMAFGLPCISYDCPCGPSDIINDGKDGFLVENGDILTFAEKIITLIEQKDLRKEMSINARKKSLSYLPDQIIPIWENLFNNLLNKNIQKNKR